MTTSLRTVVDAKEKRLGELRQRKKGAKAADSAREEKSVVSKKMPFLLARNREREKKACNERLGTVYSLTSRRKES